MENIQSKTEAVRLELEEIMENLPLPKKAEYLRGFNDCLNTFKHYTLGVISAANGRSIGLEWKLDGFYVNLIRQNALGHVEYVNGAKYAMRIIQKE